MENTEKMLSNKKGQYGLGKLKRSYEFASKGLYDDELNDEVLSYLEQLLGNRMLDSGYLSEKDPFFDPYYTAIFNKVMTLVEEGYGTTGTNKFIVIDKIVGFIHKDLLRYLLGVETKWPRAFGREIEDLWEWREKVNQEMRLSNKGKAWQVISESPIYVTILSREGKMYNYDLGGNKPDVAQDVSYFFSRGEYGKGFNILKNYSFVKKSNLSDMSWQQYEGTNVGNSGTTEKSPQDYSAHFTPPATVDTMARNFRYECDTCRQVYSERTVVGDDRKWTEMRISYPCPRCGGRLWPQSEGDIEQRYSKLSNRKGSKENLFNYQDSNQEKIIHGDWTKGSSYRYVLEGTGDIFRELTKSWADWGYINEKIERIKKYINDVKSGTHPETGIHLEDSFQYAFENNKDKFTTMLQQWESQPTETGAQKIAVELNKAMLQGNIEKTGILIEQLLSRRKGKLSNRIAQTTPIAPIPTVQQPIQPTTPTVQQPVQRLGEIPLPEEFAEKEVGEELPTPIPKYLSKWKGVSWAGRNLHIVRADYTRLDNTPRTLMLEPYSYRIKRPKRLEGGIESYFFGFDSTDSTIKGLIKSRVKKVKVLPETFIPRWEIEV